ncbi:MAG: LD-carboxypeptidase [Muricoprocola sp.]
MSEKALRMPKKLKTGDTIGVVAPSMPVQPEEKKKMKECLEKAGYHVKFGKTVEELSNFHGYLSGDAKTRAEDVNHMFADPEVDGIICARGGYGSCHTMKYLDLDLIRENPKVFVGFSDITNFHSVINKYCNLVTFHGPMMISTATKGLSDYSADSMRRALNMEKEYEFLNPEGDPMQVLIPGKAKGMITGGNISLLARSIGTFYQPDTEDKILFLEDVEETFPSLDMMISQMEQAGMMDQIRGVLLGNFSGCSNEKYDKTYELDQFLKDRFAGYQVPVMSHLCCGHASPMATIPMGTICTMDTEKNTLLFTLE